VTGVQTCALPIWPKIQDVLAHVLHRICDRPIKLKGNDFQDAKLFEEALDISVLIYNTESRQIYKGIDRLAKVNIFKSDNHYDVISNLSGFTCADSSHHKADEKQCKACKSAIKCDGSQQTSQCSTCYKFFCGKTCFDDHIKNKKCIEHSFECDRCDRFYKTKDLK